MNTGVHFFFSNNATLPILLFPESGDTAAIVFAGDFIGFVCVGLFELLKILKKSKFKLK